MFPLFVPKPFVTSLHKTRPLAVIYTKMGGIRNTGKEQGSLMPEGKFAIASVLKSALTSLNTSNVSVTGKQIP